MTNEEKMLDILASMSLRMGNIEEKIDALDNRQVQFGFQLETEIIPRIDALAEGHASIQERLVPVTRVDELENRVKILESVIGNMADDLQSLKKAQ